MPKLDIAQMLVAPEEVQLPDPLPEYKKFNRDFCNDVFAHFKKEMKTASEQPEGKRSFQWIPEEDGKVPIAFRFTWQGKGCAVLSFAGADQRGKFTNMEAMVALLLRIDGVEEAKLLHYLKISEFLPMIPVAVFADLQAKSERVAVTFFTNEEAIHNSLIYNVKMLAITAFLDIFGFAEFGKSHQIEFTGLIALPKGTENQFRLSEVPVSQDEEEGLFRQFKKMLADDAKGFEADAASNFDPEHPLTITFTWMGETSAVVVWTHNVNGQHKHTHGVTAFLTRLDAEADKQAIELAKKFKALECVPRQTFDNALNKSTPVVATFFADINSANWPPIHNVLKILSAAFFDQFGIGSEGSMSARISVVFYLPKTDKESG